MTYPNLTMDRPPQTAFKNIQTELSTTRDFLRRLAKHLDENEMPGQAGNCTLRADGLDRALISLDWLDLTKGRAEFSCVVINGGSAEDPADELVRVTVRRDGWTVVKFELLAGDFFKTVIGRLTVVDLA